MSNYPFYYKVKFHLLTRDHENNLEFHDTEKEFSNPDPLKARQEAFEEFEEYLKFLKDSNKLAEDEVGNFKIISPSDIPDKPEVSKVDGLYGRIQNWTDYMKFREEIDVLLVINDDDLMDEIGYGDRVFPIHTVASYSINQEEILENLELIELQVYSKSGISLDDHIVTVEYYGDYYDSGKSESSSTWDILPTPQSWQTLEQYQALIMEDGKKDPDGLTFEEIIAGGETNTVELKSSLAYNFSENSSNWKPLFNNAKTVCGFLNANGGLLIIGVTDDGTPQGLEKDLELLGNKDKIRLKVDDLMSTYFGNTISSLIDVAFETVADKEILVISVKPSKTPVFLKKYDRRTDITSKHFFIRRNASTTELKDVEEMITYIFNHGYPSGN